MGTKSKFFEILKEFLSFLWIFCENCLKL